MKTQFFRFAFLLICLALPLTSTAQVVDIPDPSLRAAIEAELSKGAGAPITTDEMVTLHQLWVNQTNISDLTGLEAATNLTTLDLRNTLISDISALAGLTNLTQLYLNDTSISDISALAGLTNLTDLNLWDTLISDISPLVANTGLGSGDTVNLRGNRLSSLSVDTYIPTLQSRGVIVEAPAGVWGEPRTVRAIHFLPNDRSYRAEVVQEIKDTIRTVQTFYAEQMAAHGYGRLTFRFETDPHGDPMVHRVDGTHPMSYYTDPSYSGGFEELFGDGDIYKNIYLVFIDSDQFVQARGGRRGKEGGMGYFSVTTGWRIIAHELGHAFGLQHDFRDDAYLMSYGQRLSSCHAEYLSVHPYFNSDILIKRDRGPTIELISPRIYPADSKTVPVQLKLADSDGLHQVFLFVIWPPPLSFEEYPGVIACRSLEGEEDTIVEFDYDGVIPPNNITHLSNPLIHKMQVEVVDTKGDVSIETFQLMARSPYHIATLEGHNGSVRSVSFSPDGTTLASGGVDDTLKLWDVATRQNIATIKRYDAVYSVSFSPDGTTLASGSSGIIALWDVATRQNITRLGKPFWRTVTSVSFSPDGNTIASGSRDGVVRLWDVGTWQNMATLEGDYEVNSVSFSPDGTTLASGSDAGIELWDIATRQNIARQYTDLFSTDVVLFVSFSPDGTILASGSRDGILRLWDVATQVNFVTLPHTSGILSMSFSPDGTTLAVATVDGIELYDVSKSGELVQQALTEVDIPDPNLRAAIATELRKQPSDSIRRMDLMNLRRLWVSDTAVSDITGLEFATNLTELRFFNNPSISDISALAGLNNLRRLSLSSTSISDISVLAGLTNLTRLGLYSTSISDISALAGLANLEELYLDNTSISDISVLAGLNNLRRLSLSSTSISDISVLAGLTHLEELYLDDTSISDISVLAGLTNLTRLYLHYTSISDISPLVANTGLGSESFVNLQENPLSYQSIHTHIPALQRRGVTVKFDNQAHPALLKISGDNQKGVTNTPLENPFVVEVQDENGSAFAGVSVTFTVTSGDGLLSVTNATTDANGRAESTLTTGLHPEINAVSVTAAGIEGTVTFDAISESPFIEYLLSIPAGISLIHVPLKVTAVDGAAQTIESVGGLYDALGGVSTVNYLATYNSSTQAWFTYFAPSDKGWLSYFVPSDKGTLADRRLTDDMGIIAGMKTPVSIRLKGDALRTDGSSTITLNQGLNLVGLPLRDSRVTDVSDLFALEGIRGNVPVIILTDDGAFKVVGRVDDPGDIEITGGQSFILTAQQSATVAISGQGWTNISGTAAGPPVVMIGIEVGETTPILGLKGSLVDEMTGVDRVGIRVTVKNLSTDRKVTTVTAQEEGDYRLIVVDIEGGQAGRVGDMLEISAQSPHPFIGVEPLRYTVTAADVKRGLIQLPALIAYEIPAETELLANYPNPFNPETWIPYRLAEDAFVTLTIYDGTGRIVRTLDVGHRIAAVYESRSKAIYWDGRNEFGERVASGVYFYHLSAGDYSATRKMVILK